MRFNEAAANEALEAQAEHDRLHARQNAARLANKEYRTAKQHRNEVFWHRVMRFITVITLLVVAYKLINFS